MRELINKNTKLFLIATTPSPKNPGESHEQFQQRTKDEFYRLGIRDSKPTVRKGFCYW